MDLRADPISLTSAVSAVPEPVFGDQISPGACTV